MNERIKELAEQAITERLSIDEYIEALKKEPHDFYGFRVNELEKFAQLIVEECISASRLHPNSTKSEEWQKGYTKGQMDARMLMKQHFGVAE